MTDEELNEILHKIRRTEDAEGVIHKTRCVGVAIVIVRMDVHSGDSTSDFNATINDAFVPSDGCSARRGFFNDVLSCVEAASKAEAS